MNADDTSVDIPGAVCRTYIMADEVMKTALEHNFVINPRKLYDTISLVRCEPCSMGFKSKRSLGAHRVHCKDFQSKKIQALNSYALAPSVTRPIKVDSHLRHSTDKSRLPPASLSILSPSS